MTLYASVRQINLTAMSTNSFPFALANEFIDVITVKYVAKPDKLLKKTIIKIFIFLIDFINTINSGILIWTQKNQISTAGNTSLKTF